MFEIYIYIYIYIHYVTGQHLITDDNPAYNIHTLSGIYIFISLKYYYILMITSLSHRAALNH